MAKKIPSSSIVDILDELENIREEIETIELKSAKVKEKQDQLLTTPVPDKKVKEEIIEIINELQKIAANVRSQLINIKKRADEAEFHGASTSLRIQKTQHEVLWKKFMDVMTQFNTQRLEYNEKCKARLQRQLHIAGMDVSEQEIDDMMEGDHHETGVFSSMIKNNLQAQQALVDLQIRNDEIKNLESDIVELRDLFLDVSLLVSEQGETVQSIQSHIEQASMSAEHGKKDLKKAVVYKGQGRKKRYWCIGIAAVTTTVVICIVIILIMCLVLNKC